jgi:hypothetical protein
MLKPGVLQGPLRIHVRGYASGSPILDGLLTLPGPVGGRTFDLALGPNALADADGDGVPDTIDNCPQAPNPNQGLCTPPLSEDGTSDAGADSGPDAVTDGIGDAQSSGADVRDGQHSAADLNQEIGGRDGLSDALSKDAFLAPELPALADAPIVADVRDDVTDLPVLPGPDAVADAESDTGPDLGQKDEPDAAVADAQETHPDTTPAPVLDSSGSSDDADVSPDAVVATPDAGDAADGAIEHLDAELDTIVVGDAASSDGDALQSDAKQLNNGQTCSAAGECASGFCKDGVCCKDACNDPCQSCTTGRCVTVRLRDDAPECTGSMTCNLWGSCVAR